ncbi:hypothetical protein ACFYQA_12700 [Streptomyces sp. NPDC005774]|uniref:wHTH domain-containing protein n=1 Tax=Streptomyces sp. NPDC005774 TaxID=3364728 RepID=UPI00367EC676
MDGWPDEAVDRLVGLSSRLTGLEALFLGDVVMEESEISWMDQSDLAPVLRAYPGLRELGVRGGKELEFPVVRHEGLRTLRFETGGLPAQVTRNVAASDLPSLECLELWLGDEYYGCDTTLEDLRPLLTGERLPSLRHLGLQNSEFQDEIAAAVAHAPVVARLGELGHHNPPLPDEGGFEEEDILLLSEELDGRRPWLQWGRTPSLRHVLRAAEVTGRSPQEIGERLARLGHDVHVPPALEVRDGGLLEAVPRSHESTGAAKILAVVSRTGRSPAEVAARLRELDVEIPDLVYPARRPAPTPPPPRPGAPDGGGCPGASSDRGGERNARGVPEACGPHDGRS